MKNLLVDFLNVDTRDELISILNCGKDTELFAFFGDPAEHSLSPLIYNKAFGELSMNRKYFAARIPKGEIRLAMKKARLLDLKGMNISMPHKQAILDELDCVDNLASLCGSVNTIIQEQKDVNNIPCYKGFNTDATGAVRVIDQLEEYSKGSVVILGLGGAGKAIMAGLAESGVNQITVFVRKMKIREHSEFASKISNAFPGVKISLFLLSDNRALRKAISETDLLINCSNVGMGELEGLSLIPDESYLHRDLNVMDVIYSPAKTKLLQQAETVGCRYLNGLNMLLYQGEEAFKLYTGMEHRLSID